MQSIKNKSVSTQFHNVGRERRRTLLTQCFPTGPHTRGNILHRFERTLDPDVFRTYMLSNGVVRSVYYINLKEQTCSRINLPRGWNR